MSVSPFALVNMISTGVPVVAQWVKKPTNIHADLGSVPGLSDWVNDPACRKLWCMSQMQFRSGIAMAVV